MDGQQAAPGQHGAGLAGVPLLPIFVILAGILVVVGSMGPWASVLFITSNGTEGDGVVTLFLGVAAAVLAVARLLRPPLRLLMYGAFALLAFAAVVGIYDWINIEDIPDYTGIIIDLEVKVRWGLVTTTFAGAAGAALALLDALRLFERHAAAP